MYRICIVLACFPAVAHTAVEDGAIRASASKAVALLQATGKRWFEKQSCFSCHHQALPLLAVDVARGRGVAVDERLAREAVSRSFRALESLDKAVQNSDQFDPAFNIGLYLMAASSAGIAQSLTTGTMARTLARQQHEDGRWTTQDVRPPQAHSTFTATAISLRALQLYMPPQLEAEKRARVEQARKWLLKAAPRNTEDRAFQLLGLTWARATAAERTGPAGALLAQQRADGGWAQLPAMESDAYATGQALHALVESGALRTKDDAYQRGLAYLLEKQQADGSWLVRTRIHEQHLVSPPYFETGYPHGKNQISSCMGASWATMALMHALPPVAFGRQGITLGPQGEPWMEAALFGTVDDLRSLLEAGISPNASTAAGTSMLMMAAPDPAKVKLLLSRGADANARSRTRFTALMVAAYHKGATESVRALLDAGAEVNPRPPLPMYNATALFFAAMAGHEGAARMLIEKGARIDAKMLLLGLFPVLPLHMAVYQGDERIVEMLVRKGGSVEAPDAFGVTPLNASVLANNVSMAKLILKLGAVVDRVDNYGMTALMHAASIDFGDTAMAETLLAAGANPALVAKEKLPAAGYAARYGHAGLARVLKVSAKNSRGSR